jgi:hypothetical protein
VIHLQISRNTHQLLRPELLVQVQKNPSQEIPAKYRITDQPWNILIFVAVFQIKSLTPKAFLLAATPSAFCRSPVKKEKIMLRRYRGFLIFDHASQLFGSLKK